MNSHTLADAVVLVASKDKVLSLEAVGYADIATHRPMSKDTLFWIASMSKPMTATAMVMLMDDGKVNLGDPVEKYLPEFKGQMLVAEQDPNHVLLKKPSHLITLRDVLSHTSGLPFVSRLESKIDQHPLREGALGYALTPLQFEPGSKYEYSNAGINTAGRIIEVVGGVPHVVIMDNPAAIQLFLGRVVTAEPIAPRWELTLNTGSSRCSWSNMRVIRVPAAARSTLRS